MNKEIIINTLINFGFSKYKINGRIINNIYIKDNVEIIVQDKNIIIIDKCSNCRTLYLKYNCPKFIKYLELELVLNEIKMTNSTTRIDYLKENEMKYKNVKLTREELLKAYEDGERDFRGVDLSNISLRYADLSHSDLSFANLTNTELRCTNLSNTNFCEADFNFGENK